MRMLHNLLGVARREQDADAGLRYLDGILMLDPSAAQSRMMRAGIYLSKGRKAEALADVQYLIDHPSDRRGREATKQLKRAAGRREELTTEAQRHREDIKADLKAKTVPIFCLKTWLFVFSVPLCLCG